MPAWPSHFVTRMTWLCVSFPRPRWSATANAPLPVVEAAITVLLGSSIPVTRYFVAW